MLGLYGGEPLARSAVGKLDHQFSRNPLIHCHPRGSAATSTLSPVPGHPPKRDRLPQDRQSQFVREPFPTSNSVAALKR